MEETVTEPRQTRPVRLRRRPRAGWEIIRRVGGGYEPS
jgi:hypothetical protein